MRQKLEKKKVAVRIDGKVKNKVYYKDFRKKIVFDILIIEIIYNR